MSEKDKGYFPELSKFREAVHSLVSAMNMYSKSLVDFVKERERLLAEIGQLKKERAELETEMERYAEDAVYDWNIYDQFNYECDKLWQLIIRLCLNANPPIRVREHTMKSLKEAGVNCKLKVEGRTSKLELWRGDELVGVVISTKPERVEIGFD